MYHCGIFNPLLLLCTPYYVDLTKKLAVQVLITHEPRRPPRPSCMTSDPSQDCRFRIQGNVEELDTHSSLAS